MVDAPNDTLLLLDLVGVFAFALSGGLVAVRRRFDIVGVMVLAWAAGLGGGTIRDVLIGATPPVGISDWRLVAVAAGAGLLTFVTHGRVRSFTAKTRVVHVRHLNRLVLTLDAAGLSVFCVAGSLKAVELGVGPLAAVFVGVITSVGGGIIRDVLAGQVPEVLRGQLYAVPAFLGACLVVLADEVGYLTETVAWSSVILVFVVRITAVVFDLNAPTPLRTGDR